MPDQPSDPRELVRIRRCPQCLYDLRGRSGDRRCPECGLEYDEQTFELPVVCLRLSRKRRRDQGIAVLALILVIGLGWQLGALLLPAVAILLILGGLCIMLGLDLWRRVHLMRGGHDVILLFGRDGLWEMTPRGRRRLRGWRRFHRFKLRRTCRAGRWRLKLLKPWWHLGAVMRGTVTAYFRGTPREAAVIRRTLRRLHAGGAFR